MRARRGKRIASGWIGEKNVGRKDRGSRRPGFEEAARAAPGVRVRVTTVPSAAPRSRARREEEEEEEEEVVVVVVEVEEEEAETK